MSEINLLRSLPESKRNVKARETAKTEEHISVFSPPPEEQKINYYKGNTKKNNNRGANIVFSSSSRGEQMNTAFSQ